MGLLECAFAGLFVASSSAHHYHCSGEGAGYCAGEETGNNGRGWELRTFG
jgi:hypothetical protein